MQEDPKLGLRAMKEIFDSLFYRRPKAKFKATPFTFVNLHTKTDPQTIFVDHPTDLQLDYNELVDDLEEEHLKRDVFTTERPDQRHSSIESPKSKISKLSDMIFNNASDKDHPVVSVSRNSQHG